MNLKQKIFTAGVTGLTALTMGACNLQTIGFPGHVPKEADYKAGEVVELELNSNGSHCLTYNPEWESHEIVLGEINGCFDKTYSGRAEIERAVKTEDGDIFYRVNTGGKTGWVFEGGIEGIWK